MSQVWFQRGNIFMLSDDSVKVKSLPLGVYELGKSIFGFMVTKVKEKFEFDYKLYDLESEFVDRVKRTYENTSGNLGIILNGIKGTGKTVCAKLISNVLGLPVILISSDFDDGVPGYLANIPDDVVVFIDEYEKKFGSSSQFLGLMDGADSSAARRVFILTSNELSVERNMIERPSRIRYIKEFGNLPISVVEEIIDDLLIHREWKEEIIKTIMKLNIITVDLVKAIIQEVNIHNQSPADFETVLNLSSREKNSYRSVIKTNLDTGEKELITDWAYVDPHSFSRHMKGRLFSVAHKNIGKIVDVISDSEIIVEEFLDSSDEQVKGLLNKKAREHKSERLKKLVALAEEDSDYQEELNKVLQQTGTIKCKKSLYTLADPVYTHGSYTKSMYNL